MRFEDGSLSWRAAPSRGGRLLLVGGGSLSWRAAAKEEEEEGERPPQEEEDVWRRRSEARREGVMEIIFFPITSPELAAGRRCRSGGR